MAKIFKLDEIKEALQDIDSLQAIEDGFVAYSQGKVVVPPVGELIFEDPPGDVHIKYGYIIDDDYYVIKIASGFPENVNLNLPTGNGLMLVFGQKTGELASILLDEGHLTNVRTAAAGAVATRYLAPASVHRIGILGAGVQGRMQLEYLKPVVDCNDVLAWGRKHERLEEYKEDMKPLGFDIQTTLHAEDVASTCNLIVTTTPAKAPLLMAEQIRKGTHITAMGSDTADKIELEPAILQKADIVVADSLSQCLSRGEIHHAIKAGLLKEDTVVELGSAIMNKDLRRRSDEQTTVADLTGVAVQDVQIAKAVCGALFSQSGD